MRRISAILALLVCALPAWAGLTQAELGLVGLRPGDTAQVPAGLGLSDGIRPAVLVFADFECPDICDPLVAQTADSLAGTGLAAGRDYRLIVVGLDPRDNAAARDAFLGGTLGDRRAAALVPDLGPDRLAELTDAMGFGYVYDAEYDRFAHPVTSFVLTPEGRVSRVFPALHPAPDDMRRALIEAGQGTVGGLAERLVLTCYGFDPLTGRYNLAIERILTIFGVTFALGLGSALAIAHLRERRAS
ncbi:hypothetical protein OCGS_1443 [Oceaniovalibus guishaninsula JLT2003]|uniref:Thioredoxin domain-containing protein n=1 Tax=Oceaniovalibus guishaninsula JLT2003 TaxID=1231392 RepID=K2I6J7_9RHOB|nr:hypothetical protein [Oceaniovalibus guishaninsula]EKE44605.1 hypothetical protein OCGS_1443 [Oceaniovalibus guishaninsula JLT2003]